ncbi:unnamed protein product [Mesocestoides corti]|uniref:Uncharacterized protein n=1 Tax=Mesocestoides corti TaxID=53468 RepID=A0A0R3U3S7_MESCO|nr:unnamed protein product [Mesocestoides corti]
MPVNSRTRLPSLMFTSLEIRPLVKKDNKANITPLNPPVESKLNLPYKYKTAPHLTTLSEEERLEIERVFPLLYPHDEWARIKWGNYMLPTSPTEIHTTPLSHVYYSDPLPGRLPPIIYK